MNIDRGRPIQKVDTLLNADAVEWCPHPGLQHVLLCGTYKLLESTHADHMNNEDPVASSVTNTGPEACEDLNTATALATAQVRVGGVITYKVLFSASGQAHLEECCNMSTCGVLDIKWLETAVGHRFIYGVVDAEGQFQMFQLEEDSYASKFLAKGKLSDSSLGLSLSWADHSEGSPLVTASDSAGYVTVFEIGDDISATSSWKAHDYEAWITAFHKFDHSLVFSGGDDCKLKCWDLRNTSQPTFCSNRSLSLHTDNSISVQSSPIDHTRRISAQITNAIQPARIPLHQMGVCSIQSHPFNEHLFASGSYDEEVIVWDRRKLKQPLSSSSLGGGVWRIKWDPFSGSHILTATMYNGTHIVDCTDLGQSSLPIVAQYDDHNLAYGADWCRLRPDGISRACSKPCDDNSCTSFTGKKDSFLISTCSFYDHSLHIWEWDS